MAQTIKLRRSGIAGKVPTVDDIELGELAINTVDGRVFINKNDSSIEHIVTTNSLTTGSIDLLGNLTIQGDIIAENYIISSSVMHLTASARSGSTISGDTADDTHQFTGSLFITGAFDQRGGKVEFRPQQGFQIHGQTGIGASQGSPYLFYLNPTTEKIGIFANNDTTARLLVKGGISSSTYYGDGSNLTGIPSSDITALNNATGSLYSFSSSISSSIDNISSSVVNLNDFSSSLLGGLDPILDPDLLTFNVYPNTTISSFGASLTATANAASARTTLELSKIDNVVFNSVSSSFIETYHISSSDSLVISSSNDLTLYSADQTIIKAVNNTTPITVNHPMSSVNNTRAVVTYKNDEKVLQYNSERYLLSQSNNLGVYKGAGMATISASIGSAFVQTVADFGTQFVAVHMNYNAVGAQGGYVETGEFHIAYNQAGNSYNHQPKVLLAKNTSQTILNLTSSGYCNVSAQINSSFGPVEIMYEYTAFTQGII